MIGATLQYASTRTNETSPKTLITKGNHTKIFPNARSSEAFKLSPSNNPPTPVTNVKEPSQSTRRSFSELGCFCISSESGISTRRATISAARMRGGI